MPPERFYKQAKTEGQIMTINKVTRTLPDKGRKRAPSPLVKATQLASVSSFLCLVAGRGLQEVIEQHCHSNL